MEQKVANGPGIVDMLGNHQVYGSLSFVFSECARELGAGYEKSYPEKFNTVFWSRYKHISYSKIQPHPKKIYVLNSPLIFLEGWEFLLKGRPLIIMEEYFRKGGRGIKDYACSVALRMFESAAFIAQTKRTSRFLRENGLSAFHVPPAEQKGVGAKRRKHILFVGRLEMPKNPLLFLELSKRFPEEKFIMVGRGEMSGELERLAKGTENLRIIPWVEKKEDLFKLYSEAKALVHPSIRDPVAFVMIEALSTQTPVLSSSWVGASDYLPPDWVIKEDGPAAWERALKGLLDKQNESVRLAEETFEKEHLDIKDKYFKKTASELASGLRARWPNMFG